MNIEHVEKSYQELESDSTLQNLIAQANARYILYNTEESKENFPRYTIKDEQLNILAFKYLMHYPFFRLLRQLLSHNKIRIK